ncbi:copper resistance protein NlpE [Vibrio sp.]|uniref:Copper resistance protein NlpE n=1 Tax=Vibrio viridaestus TaxID=2487322 RepID=A0A3N9TLF4_9VIBR|nr:copper resistance protein NlpE [Vibrio viridaestus]MDC0610589.1 copper resistance protein NlpE [Vibrio sp.]RQW65107.1 copper resistance protein NlpE [Vibrio viridaestus]
MKKTIFTLSALTLALALTGCDNSDKTAAQNDAPAQPSADVAGEAPTAADAMNGDVTEGISQVPATSEDTPVAPETDATAKAIPAAKDNIEWQGTYKGTLPCADCDGIETTLTLNSDETYTLEENYLGKKDGQIDSKGSFTWDKSGTIVTLQNDKGDTPVEYSVSENQITKLDNNGEPIKGDLAQLYNLNKEVKTN